MIAASQWALALAASAVVAGLVLAFAVRARQRARLRRVEEGLLELARGNLAHRVVVSGTGAAAELASAVNELAEALQDARADGLRREEAHRQLISNLAHDLRTPITAMVGYVDALRRGIGEDPKRQLDTLAGKTTELTRLADDLFYLTKLDSGDLRLELGIVDLGEAARRAILGFEPELASRGLEVVVDIHDAPCGVSADEAAVARVIGNFVANSLRHARGMTRLGVSVGSADDTCTVTVWDDGEGFPKGVGELLERGASVGPGGGSGLGLSIAHDLATRMGATLHATSEPNVRSAVSVTFPLVSEVVRSPSARTGETSAPGSDRRTLASDHLSKDL